MRKNRIYEYYRDNPYAVIMGLALLVRLLAAIFSRGFGMSDDHYCVIKIAQELLDKRDSLLSGEVPIRNLFYIGIHYYFFAFLELLRITDPQIKMFFVRIFHALYSLLIVWGGIRLTEELSDSKNAVRVGWFLALFWLLPFMSVRNLIEVVAIPPLLFSLHYVVKSEERTNWKYIILAGILAGIAFVLRYQTASFIGIVGIILVLEKRIKTASLYTAGFVFITVLVLGVLELAVFGQAFATLKGYILYNSDKSNIALYPIAPWYKYTETILGFLLPPISFFLVAGYIKSAKKLKYIFWPTLAFFVFHSIYPNKQERFIFPIVPFLVVSGTVGWSWIADRIHNRSLLKLEKLSWGFFWIVNIFLMTLGVFNYSKKALVEPLSYLSHKEDLMSIIVYSDEPEVPLVPRFYLGVYEYYDIHGLSSNTNATDLVNMMDSSVVIPNYAIIYGNKNIDERIDILKNYYKSVNLEKVVKPSLIDFFLHKINPKHQKNRVCYIYKVAIKK